MWFRAIEGARLKRLQADALPDRPEDDETVQLTDRRTAPRCCAHPCTAKAIAGEDGGQGGLGKAHCEIPMTASGSQVASPGKKQSRTIPRIMQPTKGIDPSSTFRSGMSGAIALIT
jgi:hypothetical protein